MSTSTRPIDDETDLTLERTVARLVTDAREVRAATAVLSGSPQEAQQRYGDELATTMANLELDLCTAKAALAARLAGTTDELHGTLADVEDAARSWLDDLAVQADQGRMEARDRAEAITRRLDRAGAEAKRAAERVADAVESDLDEMRRATLHGIGAVRAALADAVSAIRDLDDD